MEKLKQLLDSVSTAFKIVLGIIFVLFIHSLKKTDNTVKEDIEKKKEEIEDQKNEVKKSKDSLDQHIHVTKEIQQEIESNKNERIDRKESRDQKSKKFFPDL